LRSYIFLENEYNIKGWVPAPLQKIGRAVICNRTYPVGKLALLLTLLARLSIIANQICFNWVSSLPFWRWWVLSNC